MFDFPSLQPLASSLPDLPADAWPLAPAVLLLLAAAALIDAFTARVPDPLIFVGLLLTTAVRGFMTGWPSASHYLLLALAGGFLVWALNAIWYRFAKRDAIGMGDGKWTMLAVDAFGPLPPAIAWGAGAWLALIYIGARLLSARLRGRNRDCAYVSARVHFVPFLFLGLLAGIYWLYLR